MSLCNCAFGPRCESNRNCEDDNQNIGSKDPRTGAVRKRANWSVVREPRRAFQRLHVRFYCDECWKAQQEADEKPIPGIDRPPHASEFWRPSFTAMIDHALRTIAEEKRKAQPPQPIFYGGGPIVIYNPGPQHEERLRRIRELSPDQYRQLLHYRRSLREL